MTEAELPPTRWEGPTDIGRGYGRHFADLVAAGHDIEGEARLADALAPRGARILDAGSGMGRIGAALRRAGHEAVGVDLDAGLLEQSRATYPDLPVAQGRLEALDAAFFAAHGMPTEYDVVVCVGNVMVLLAEGSERAVLRAFRRPAGSRRPGAPRLLAGRRTAAVAGLPGRGVRGRRGRPPGWRSSRGTRRSTCAVRPRGDFAVFDPAERATCRQRDVRLSRGRRDSTRPQVSDH